MMTLLSKCGIGRCGRGHSDESRLRRWLVCVRNPGASPQACDEAAPLALDNNDVGLMQTEVDRATTVNAQLSTQTQKPVIRGIRASAV